MEDILTRRFKAICFSLQTFDHVAAVINNEPKLHAIELWQVLGSFSVHAARLAALTSEILAMWLIGDVKRLHVYYENKVLKAKCLYLEYFY